MNVNQDIQSHKIRHLPNGLYWTCLFKSIKGKLIPKKTYDLKDKNKWNWLNRFTQKNTTQGRTYQKYYLKINIFYFLKKFRYIYIYIYIYIYELE
jgi:hypothetical protein